MNPRRFCIAITALAAIGLSNQSFAATCIGSDVTWNGENSTTCQVGVGKNDKLQSPLTVNEEKFFGFENWSYIAKSDGGGLSDGLSYDSDGSWTFSGDLSGYTNVMMVLKQSNEFSGYLAPNTDSTFGTWRTTLNLGGDLSHMTIYGRTAVPLPAAAWLFGSALLGIVGIGYRRKPGLS